jgi:hypothetical protein
MVRFERNLMMNDPGPLNDVAAGKGQGIHDRTIGKGASESQVTFR